MKHIIEQLNRIENYSLFACKRALTIDDASLLTGLSKSYIYKLTSSRQIPYYKKSKMIYFDKEELDKWMLSNRIKTQEETEKQAFLYDFNKNHDNNGR